MSAKYARGGRGGLVLAALAMVVISALPSYATAGLIGDAHVVFTACDTSGTCTGSLSFDIPANGLLTEVRSLATAFEIMDQFGTLMARITEVEYEAIDDPAVRLKFTVLADGEDLDFTVTAPAVAVPSYVNPSAYASAGMTLTSNGGTAKATGAFTGVKSYRAIYNTTDWTYLVEELVATDTTVSVSRRDPLTGTSIIPATVTSISSEFKFHLTANDEASGTSRFEVTPEPATLALLGLGAVALVSRRRRR